MNTYRDYINAQERSCMSNDEKLEKKNMETLMHYSTVGANIGTREISENTGPKAEALKKEPGKCRNMR